MVVGYYGYDVGWIGLVVYCRLLLIVSLSNCDRSEKRQ